MQPCMKTWQIVDTNASGPAYLVCMLLAGHDGPHRSPHGEAPKNANFVEHTAKGRK